MINLAFAVSAIIAFSAPPATISWNHFHSKLYPYSISQPSSFRHVVISTDENLRIDYFAPSLGSYTTNVSVSATRGGPLINVASDMHARDGQGVKTDGTLPIMKRRLVLTRAGFHGLAGTWVEEQVSFAAGGYSWRLTLSYDTRYKSLRKMMLHMLQSFDIWKGFYARHH